MMASIVVSVLLLSALPLCGAQDPSLVPLDEGERYRLRKDLNGDGRLDLILSLPCHMFGHGGGHWDVYLEAENGDFTPAGRIQAQVGFIRSETHHQTNRIWFAWGSAAWLTTIGYYELKDGSVGEPTAIDIHAGDGGNELGRALFDAVFPNGSDPDLEVSRTVEGQVTWTKCTELFGGLSPIDSPSVADSHGSSE